MNDVPCTYRISVKAAITDDAGRILLVKDKDGGWELPGGGIEHGEDPKAALVREIDEETSMTVDYMSEQPVAFWTFHKKVGSPVIEWFAFIVYEAKVSGEFKPNEQSDEALEANYYTKAEARQLQLHDSVRHYFV